jgi:hypothetical protein
MVRLWAVEFGLEVEGVLEMDPVLGVEWVVRRNPVLGVEGVVRDRSGAGGEVGIGGGADRSGAGGGVGIGGGAATFEGGGLLCVTSDGSGTETAVGGKDAELGEV